jgi:hypothetical protein
MSNAHFKERGMSLKAKGLLSLMLSLPDDWSYNVSGLVKLSKDGKDSVMSALAELEKFGYLERKQVVNDKGQFAGVEYNIFELPQLEKPNAEKENAAKQKTEKANAEKPRLLSTNSINNDLINNLDISSTKKDKEKEKIDSLLQEVGNVELIELYWDYIDMRKGMDAPLTAKGLEMLIARCERLSKNNVRVQKLLLENAIINGWKNVFLPKESELASVNQEYQADIKSLLGID